MVKLSGGFSFAGRSGGGIPLLALLAHGPGVGVVLLAGAPVD